MRDPPPAAPLPPPIDAHPTRRDLGQLLWALLLVELVVAGLSLLVWHGYGPRPALWFLVGAGALVAAAFALVVGASVVLTYLVEGRGKGD